MHGPPRPGRRRRDRAPGRRCRTLAHQRGFAAGGELREASRQRPRRMKIPFGRSDDLGSRRRGRRPCAPGAAAGRGRSRPPPARPRRPRRGRARPAVRRQTSERRRGVGAASRARSAARPSASSRRCRRAREVRRQGMGLLPRQRAGLDRCTIPQGGPGKAWIARHRREDRRPQRLAGLRPASARRRSTRGQAPPHKARAAGSQAASARVAPTPRARPDRTTRAMRRATSRIRGPPALAARTRGP